MFFMLIKVFSEIKVRYEKIFKIIWDDCGIDGMEMYYFIIIFGWIIDFILMKFENWWIEIEIMKNGKLNYLEWWKF